MRSQEFQASLQHQVSWCNVPQILQKRLKCHFHNLPFTRELPLDLASTYRPHRFVTLVFHSHPTYTKPVSRAKQLPLRNPFQTLPRPISVEHNPRGDVPSAQNTVCCMLISKYTSLKFHQLEFLKILHTW